MFTILERYTLFYIFLLIYNRYDRDITKPRIYRTQIPRICSTGSFTSVKSNIAAYHSIILSGTQFILL